MKDLTDKEFILIRDYIKEHYGINLGDEKKSLIYSRLRSVLQEKGFIDFTEYYKYLISDKSGEAAIKFIDKITTNHTFFMREPDHFYYFRDNVLPYIEQKHKASKDIRVWCAGCSSGEEAYTLQIIIQEYFCNKPGWNTELLATDISANVLSKAIQGVYSNDSIKTVPDNWKKKYFSAYDKDNSIVSEKLKSQITFRKFNLMDAKFHFKKPLQTIFCRNVMIYFDNETRAELVKRFYDSTENEGYFFIGHSESLNQSGTEYKYILPAIYRKM